MEHHEQLAPTTSDRRILALDAARGFAILGIFCVNVALMARPLVEMFSHRPPEGAPAIDIAAWAFVRVFCEGKFYPLFSILFGMGFVLLIDRARERGVRVVPLYLRRILVLALFGIAHIALLWYGDILLIYSVCALALLLAHRASARTLLILAGIFMAVSLLTAAVGVTLMTPPEPGQAISHTEAASEPPPEKTPDEAPPGPPSLVAADAPAQAPSFAIDPGRPPAEQFLELLESSEDPFVHEEQWAELEIRANREGPFDQAMTFRLIHYAMFAVFAMPFGFGPHVLSMFFLGAALMRLGVLSHRHLLMRFVALGMSVGLPAAVVIAIAQANASEQVASWLSVATFAIAPFVSLLYLAAIALACSTPLARFVRLLAPVGQMALTNYLLQSLVMAYIMQHWGLGRFADFSRAQLLAMVFAIYAAQIVLSNLWMRVFRFGPTEWLWRTLTYLRPQPILRSPSARSTPHPSPQHPTSEDENDRVA